ncbi:DarT ssDNA thymidine ADP-ribosyltransferase family protein [Pseudomonas psychrophila]|uniref:DarT ssDNA thymidine ADP-ribosyltransferase family protein n=1 Tax=Pseudomonas psychrophila TaxID=122355 RepID=UPI0037F9639C
MRDALKKYNVGFLWHFTDKRNVESIKKHGLLSWRELQRIGLAPAVPGGNKWSHDADEFSGVDNYVHLSFNQENPMLYIAKRDKRIDDHVWLQIDSSVISAGTRYTDDVANKADVQMLDNDSAVEKIDFEALFKYMDFKVEGNKERKHAAAKSEILVPVMVGIDKIKGL